MSELEGLAGLLGADMMGLIMVLRCIDWYGLDFLKQTMSFRVRRVTSQQRRKTFKQIEYLTFSTKIRVLLKYIKHNIISYISNNAASVSQLCIFHMRKIPKCSSEE